MKQLNELFSAFSEVFSPNTPKQLAKQCIIKGECYRTSSGNIEWTYKDYGIIMQIDGNDFELNLYSNNGDTELMHLTGSVVDEIPMQEWDNVEIEIYLREEVLS